MGLQGGSEVERHVWASVLSGNPEF
jgi:hypothetical protein